MKGRKITIYECVHSLLTLEEQLEHYIAVTSEDNIILF